MAKLKLYGFDGSTYVRTVKMLLAEKTFSDFEQDPVNVLEGGPKTPEHLARHPFGKVPVIEHDGMRILETSAITRYLNDVLPGPSLMPATPKDRAKVDMVVGLVDSYGYGALLGGVAAYHLFPDFVGGKNEQARQDGIKNGKTILKLAMDEKGSADFIGGSFSLAELYLAPILFYVSMTPDKDDVLSVPGVGYWWAKVSARPSFKATEPKFD